MTKFKRLMSKKFERILPYSTIEELWHMYEDFEDFACAIEQAVLAKLAEQEPVTTVSQETFSSNGTSDIITNNLPVGAKLYTHPVPCVAPVSDKTACDSQNTKYATQTSSQVNLDSSSHIADIGKMVVPDGWQLVPVEITIDMCEASGLEGEFKLSPYEQAQVLWKDMLAAAPKYTRESK